MSAKQVLMVERVPFTNDTFLAPTCRDVVQSERLARLFNAAMIVAMAVESTEKDGMNRDGFILDTMKCAARTRDNDGKCARCGNTILLGRMKHHKTWCH